MIYFNNAATSWPKPDSVYKTTDNFFRNSGATESLNTVIKGVLKRGDHVITSKIEHNSVIRPLERLKIEREIDVDYIDID
jgi:cysteine sulfinate desulfinase/cysteine desulfurase-like protein